MNEDPVKAYEEFRANKEYDAGEERLKAWPLLTVTEQRAWMQSHRVYFNDTKEHGDPAITAGRRPID